LAVGPDGLPAFLNTTKPNAQESSSESTKEKGPLWVAILEKAWAKANGSYASIINLKPY